MQNAQKKNDRVRKVLVRNAIIPAKPCETTRCEKKRVQFVNLIDEEDEEEGPSCSDEKDFSSPEFNSILKLAEEIKRLQFQPLKELRMKQGGGSNCIASGNVMRFNMNFEPDEKLYQDLVSVEKPETEHEPKVKITSQYKSTMKRDPEPDYKALLSHSFQPGYRFPKTVVPKVERPAPEYDGRSVYRFLKQSEIDF